jgi:hypothetical protein
VAEWRSDFSYAYFQKLLSILKSAYQAHWFREAPEVVALKSGRHVFLRHDVDVDLSRAVRMAEIERDHGVPATYMIMTKSKLYNLGDSASRKALKALVEMGHEVGLHYDCPASFRQDASDISEILQDMLLDCEKIEDVLEVGVTSISFHRPITKLLRGPLLISNRVNAYAAELMVHYISDSKGTWRSGEPLLALQDSNNQITQVLIHPIWWGERHLSAEARLEDFLQSEISRRKITDVEEFDAILRETLPGVPRRPLAARGR